MADVIYKINNNGSEYNIASSAYCTCATSAGTAAKIAYLQSSSSNAFCNGTIPTGIVIQVKFTYSNTSTNPTLNVNNSGAKSIKLYGTTSAGTNAKLSWRAGAIVSFVYDGTNWVMVAAGWDSNDDSDVKNTAGAANSTAELYIVGALEQSANPQTYTSDGISMSGDTLKSKRLNVQQELYFTDGAMIHTYEGILQLSGESQRTCITSDVNITNNLTIGNKDGATEAWLQEYLENWAPKEPEIQIGTLTVGFETDIYNTPGDMNGGYVEEWYLNNEVGEGIWSEPITVIPYQENSRAGQHYLYIQCDYATPQITWSGGIDVAQSEGTGYIPVEFTFDGGTLLWESCWITVTAPGIEYTIVIDFDQNYYED